MLNNLPIRFTGTELRLRIYWVFRAEETITFLTENQIVSGLKGNTDYLRPRNTRLKSDPSICG